MSTIKSSDEHLTLNADGSSKDIKLQSNASEKVIIKSTGNVGIGTASPSSKLHVYDGAGANIAIQSSAGSHWRIGDAVGASNGQLVIRDHTNSANRITILADGKVQTAQGILFGSDTGTANTLDDYEEGTWTPSFNGTGGASGQVYTDQSGHYTKIGNKCFCSCNLHLSTKGTISGFVKISGMPFTVASGTAAANAGATAYAHKWDLDSGHVLEVWIYNTNTIYLMQTEYAGDAPTQLTTGHMQNTTGVKVTFSYTTG